jgi:hypothetical protein
MRQPLIKVNVGQSMGNHGGHLRTVLQRYWKVQGPVYMTLQNIFLQILLRHNKLYESSDKITPAAQSGGFFILKSFFAFGITLLYKNVN